MEDLTHQNIDIEMKGSTVKRTVNFNRDGTIGAIHSTYTLPISSKQYYMSESWYPNGSRKSVTIHHSISQLCHFDWFEDGKLQKEQHFDFSGKPTGIHRDYHENGSLWQSWDYTKSPAECIAFYDNGQVMSQTITEQL